MSHNIASSTILASRFVETALNTELEVNGSLLFATFQTIHSYISSTINSLFAFNIALAFGFCDPFSICSQAYLIEPYGLSGSFPPVAASTPSGET